MTSFRNYCARETAKFWYYCAREFSKISSNLHIQLLKLHNVVHASQLNWVRIVHVNIFKVMWAWYRIWEQNCLNKCCECEVAKLGNNGHVKPPYLGVLHRPCCQINTVLSPWDFLNLKRPLHVRQEMCGTTKLLHVGPTSRSHNMYTKMPRWN